MHTNQYHDFMQGSNGWSKASVNDDRDIEIIASDLNQFLQRGNAFDGTFKFRAKNVVFKRCELVEQLVISNVTFPGNLYFVDCKFRSGLKLKGVDVKELLQFKGKNEFYERTELELQNCGLLDISGQRFQSELWITNFSNNMEDCIHQLDAQGANFEGPITVFVSPSLVDFSNARFAKSANLTLCKFKHDANFLGANFYGDADFSNSTFEGVVHFSVGLFQTTADFSKARFNGVAFLENRIFNGIADFRDCHFDQDAVFFETQFKSSAFFSRAVFKGGLELSGSKEASFSGDMRFDNVIFLEDAKFNNRTFSGNTSFASASFNNAPQFFNCKLFSYTDFWGAKFKDVTSEIAETAYRSLRQRSNEIESHHDEQMFFGKEMQSRKHRLRGTERMLYAIYESTSEYGASIWKPIRALIVATTVAAVMQGLVSWTDATNAECKTACNIRFDSNKLIQIVGLTFSNSFPFIPAAKEAPKAEDIFSKENPAYSRTSQIISFVYGFFSFLFLFLTALAIRNQFRMK